MTTSFAHRLDALATWRQGLELQAASLARHVKAHDLDDGDSAVRALESLRQRLSTDRLSVAFVAEFSRGKSELINAIFFADTGRRVLPATPGRTTMCPVEIAYDAGTPPRLALLPIETRLESMPLSTWREHGDRWTFIDLDPSAPQKLSEALAEVMRTKPVDIATARALGLWHDDRPDDNPPVVADGQVEIPAWRHVTINYPHPLLRRGLVVLDTPGLNAIGAEPELTLSLLPSAHAVVFILGADTGVTKSDLAVWRDHLSSPALTRLVALNKVDTLADPLLTRRAVEMQVQAQRQSTATQLGIDISQVFPVSARLALTGRIEGRSDLVNASRLFDLEQALGAELLPQRHERLGQSCEVVVQAVERAAIRRVNTLRRDLAEQILELKDLRGKNGTKTTLLARRVEQESAEFERGVVRVAAIQAMHGRMLRNQKLNLSMEAVAGDVEAMQMQIMRSMFNLGAKKAFVALFERLRQRLNVAQQHGAEALDLLDGSFKQLNSEFGFSLSLPPAPDFGAGARQLDQIEQNYIHYLGLSNAFKLSDDRFMDQFRRMLLAKLQAIFEAGAADVETWHRAAATQLESQLSDRRDSFERRHEALSRVATAQDELESRIGDLEDQDKRLQALALHTRELTQAMRRAAGERPRALDATATPASPDVQDTVSEAHTLGGDTISEATGMVQAATSHGETHVDTVALPLRG
jgi:hypothetical protein